MSVRSRNGGRMMGAALAAAVAVAGQAVAQDACGVRSEACGSGSAVPAALIADDGRPFLGVHLEDSSSSGFGVEITEVVGRSAAERAGLESGDVIVSLDGQTIDNVDDLVNALSDKSVGQKVRISFLRDGDRHRTSAKLGGRDDDSSQVEVIEEQPEERRELRQRNRNTDGQGWLGVSIADANGGVEVSQVVDRSPAGEAGIQSADLITRIGKEDIDGVDDLIQTVSSMAPGTETSVTFQRSGATHKTRVILGDRQDFLRSQGQGGGTSGGADAERIHEEMRERAEQTRREAEQRAQRQRRDSRNESGAAAERIEALERALKDLKRDNERLRETNEKLRRSIDGHRKALEEVKRALKGVGSDDRTSATQNKVRFIPSLARHRDHDEDDDHDAPRLFKVVLGDGEDEPLVWKSDNGGKVSVQGKVIISTNGDTQVIELDDLDDVHEVLNHKKKGLKGLKHLKGLKGLHIDGLEGLKVLDDLDLDLDLDLEHLLHDMDIDVRIHGDDEEDGHHGIHRVIRRLHSDDEDDHKFEVKVIRDGDVRVLRSGCDEDDDSDCRVKVLILDGDGEVRSVRSSACAPQSCQPVECKVSCDTNASASCSTSSACDVKAESSVPVDCKVECKIRCEEASSSSCGKASANSCQVKCKSAEVN